MLSLVAIAIENLCTDTINSTELIVQTFSEVLSSLGCNVHLGISARGSGR